MAAKPECAAWFSGADIGNSVRKSGAPLVKEWVGFFEV